ncbi:glycosyl hydrolase catalytic core-domain-containing protein [Colletotrichum godetiae]|uniref:Glycosyl hydrolase catalytic core-domain-containing protein n=1 Tax=Colletotrichum godetiae TaxID=1209918 RepID=A0AAJ0AZ10_9PEZI|nr:glycosyl hydrolase catalytic core-domain-containing protein [Colletotrichum godetiae]KAK1700100.1 glycosyl hydrolase catalytic core-domain-containing protein [Colletotrichum godetiae]
MAKPITSKRCLLWDYTNTRDRPDAIDQLFPTTTSSATTSKASESATTPIPVTPFKSVHNWNAWYPPELKGRLPFRPMIRTRAQLDTEEWDWIRDSDAEMVHYFNEPERQGISPGDAAAWWLEKVVPELREKRGKKLVGPACASDSGGEAWLAEFMRVVYEDENKQKENDGEKKRMRPDFLGVHYYSGDVEHAKLYLTSMYERYELPLNVSEIASISRDPGKVEAFTEELSGWMDEREWIDEYGWFGCMAHCADDFVSPAAQLMDGEGKFTPLMRRLMGHDPSSTSC